MIENASDKYIANIIMCVLICILNISFNSAYGSYFFIISIIYLSYLSYRFKLKDVFHIPVLLKVIVGISIAFYGILFIESLVLQDNNSVRTSLELVKYILPLFLIGIIGFFEDVSLGAKWGILISSFLNSVVAILQHEGLQIGYVGYIHFLPRVSGFFEHPNTLASVIAVTVPFIIYFMAKSKNRYYKVLYLGLVGINIYSLYLTGSRGGIVSTFLSIFVMGIGIMIRRRKEINRKVVFLLVCLMLIFGGIFGWMIHQNNIDRTFGERTIMREASIEMWKDHKVLGVGLARWHEQYYSERYHPKEGKETGLMMPHNMPLYFLSCAGIIGVMGYILFSSTLFGVMYIVYRRRPQGLALPMMASYIAFLIEGLVDSTIINKQSAFVFFCLFGVFVNQEIMLGQSYQENRK